MPSVTLAVAIARWGMGGFFATALLTGGWKYAHIRRTEEGTASAPAYVSTAHRAAFAYAFSCMLLERFAELRGDTRLTSAIDLILGHPLSDAKRMESFAAKAHADVQTSLFTYAFSASGPTG